MNCVMFFYRKVNGYSYKILDLDSEDDDLANRLRKNGYDVVQEVSRGGYFHNPDHAQAETNSNRYSLVTTTQVISDFKLTLYFTCQHLKYQEYERKISLMKV